MILDLTTGALPPAGARRKGHRFLGGYSAEVHCQRAVLRGARDYLRHRIPERGRGLRGAGARPAFLEEIGAACRLARTTPLPGGRMPGVAGACAALYEGAVGPDEETLGRCLVASLEAAIDRALPRAMRPNLVLILTDDQRADSIEFMPETLERVARRGLRLSNGFVTTPVCGPSRVSLLTGQYASHHGVLTNGHLPRPDEHDFDEDRSLGRWLQAAGYRTGFFGKYVNGSAAREPRVPLGWDAWQVFRNPKYYGYTLNVDGELVDFGRRLEDYSTDVLAARAREFMETHRESPFLVVLSVFAPHAPVAAADRHAGSLAGLEPARPPNFMEPDLSGKPQWIRLLRVFPPAVEEVDALRIAQLESLLAVDDAVGTLLDALERLGLTDNTAIVFTSDNGFHWGEHWWTSKFTAYEESLRVPLLMSYPVARPVAAESDALALNIDLAPTFADLAGVAPMIDVDGESLRPLLVGESFERDRFAFEVFDRFVVAPMQGVRESRYKLIATRPARPLPFLELYDLVDDPFELVNRAGDPALADVRERLRSELAEILPRPAGP